MTAPGQMLPALDFALSRARHLLLDFDGVITGLCQPAARARTVGWLRARLADPATGYDGPVPDLADPAAVLCACEIGGARRRLLEDELAGREFAAATTAQPVSSAPELIAAAPLSGRTVAVITSCAARAADSWLQRAGLAALTGPAIGRKPGKPASGEPAALLARSARRLRARPGTCAVVSARPDLLTAATEAQIPAIRYHSEPGQPGWLPGHLVTVPSLDYLVQWLRSRPLP